MTTVSTLILAAYRESNFTGQAVSLTTEEQNEGLALLQSLVDSFFPTIVGTRYNQWWIPYPNKTAPDTRRHPAEPGEPNVRYNQEQKYPPSNTRLIMRNDATETIYFQYQPEDGATMQVVDAGFTADVTLEANGHFFGDTGVDTSITLTSAVGGGSRSPTRQWLFRGDLGSWVEITDLLYVGNMAFPAIFDDYWITALAMRLSPRFGNEPKQITMLRNKEMLTFIHGWYRQTAEALIGQPGIPTEQSYYGGRYLDDPDLGRV